MRIFRPIWISSVLLAATALPGQTARLANISTRGQVGTDANNLFGGFAISGGSKTVLVRAIGPGLAAFNVPGTLADPTLAVFDSRNAVVASNDNWNAADGGTFSQVGAFPLPPGSRDAVVVATLQPGSYSAQISGLGAANTGVAILEVYDVSGSGQLVNIATRLQVGTGANAAVAGFVVAPGAGTRKLLVRGIGPALGGFGLPGFLRDPKLTLLDANQTVLATAVANVGATAIASAYAQAGAFAATANDAVVIATVAPGNYTVQLAGDSGTTSGVGLIEVYDITHSTGTPPGYAMLPRLFYANLRPAAGLGASTASGYATVLLDPNTNTASVSVSFSNLSAAQTGAHLVLGAGSGNFVVNLPRTQVAGQFWNFPAAGSFSTNDIVAALLTGNIGVQLDTASFPNGELLGSLAPARGSASFTAPAAPPALAAGALTTPSQTDAARFLTQATFGPTTATIAALRTRGINGWIDDQMALPSTGALAGLRADLAAFPKPPIPPIMGNERFGWYHNWNAAWWKIAATAPDQLRQRVAFALSELLVIGDQDDLTFNIETMAHYYDLLVTGAFGNYRTLLENVTLHPAMGLWLSHRGNVKADPVKGTAPDENYARELQQLFTIGLVQLQPDGTLILDAAGQPIPTYNQATITETAKVLTGFSYAGYPANVNQASFSNFYPNVDTSKIYPAPLPDTNPWLVPMAYYDAYHDKTAKSLVSLDQVPLAEARPTAIPAGQAGPQELKILLDTLFNHPNTGPFISKHLIQRLVTSNPSPGYLYRVAQVFANDGTGTRGNLGAVVRAILTDYEARSPDVLNNFGYGKIREPLLRMSAFLRALNAAAPNGRYMDSFYGDPRGTRGYLPSGFFVAPQFSFAQAPLLSPTVFNFFSPAYSPPGAMAAAGLVAPELEITDANFSILFPNQLASLMYRDLAALPAAPSPSPYITVDYSALLPNARNPSALIDQLNLLFCANQMSAATRSQIIATLNSFASTATDLERVQTAIQFTVTSPDGALQK